MLFLGFWIQSIRRDEKLRKRKLVLMLSCTVKRVPFPCWQVYVDLTKSQYRPVSDPNTDTALTYDLAMNTPTDITNEQAILKQLTCVVQTIVST